MNNILPHYRKTCDNRQFCFVYAHTDPDPCPDISKYLEIVYTCEQKGGLFFLQFKKNKKVKSIVLSWSTITVEGSCVWFAHSVPARPGRRGWEHHRLPALCLLLLCQLHCQQSPLEWRFLLEAFKQYVPTQWPHTHTHAVIFDSMGRVLVLNFLSFLQLPQAGSRLTWARPGK